MANEDSSSSRFWNYPELRAYDIPYKAPPAISNPVFRGLPLKVGSSIVASVGPIATFLYGNAGFACLRGLKEVEGIDCRFDPTVIPIKREGVSGSLEHTFEANLRVGGKEGDSAVDTRLYGVTEYHEVYKSGRLTPMDVVNKLLPLIRRDVTPRSEHATSFISTQVELVLAAAEASTQRYAAGKSLGILDGIPIGVKDEVNVKGYSRCLGTTKTFNNGDVETSWCVKKWEESGAIIVGKTNMHEIGMDTTNLNVIWGTPLNPYNKGYFTGGSSGGSGYAVGAGLVPIALGLDGGGSIRIPSSYCGIFGLKTSHNRVSAFPTTCLTGTNTVIGPMAADMASLEIAYRVMATPDPTSLFPSPKRPARSTDRPRVIGIYKQWFDRADEPVKTLCNKAISYMQNQLGYEVVDITIPLIHQGQPAHALTILSEAVNGHPDPSFLTPATRVLISVGSKCPTSDFLQAQRVRNLLMQHLASLYKRYPGLLIVTPSTPTVGWKIKSPTDLIGGCSDGDMSIRSMEYVWLANFTGCPCMQVPVGYAEAEGGGGDVPVGMMAMGEWGSEDELIEWGYDGERCLNEIGRVRPPVWVDVLGVEEMGNSKTGNGAGVGGLAAV
ncbi:amidase signature enzyme [Tothia fuscella]|uniref:Amidase signature enzyme n=1 Tax=Tothia fuscella TaxID=1048955 RepID=A0A9P4TYD3_9PEZI|nr:amidase signature enzyme [Tothia fuscella]